MSASRYSAQCDTSIILSKQSASKDPSCHPELGSGSTQCYNKRMGNFLSIFLGKALIFLSSNFNLGSGSTWPGHIALKLNKNFIKETLGSHTKVVLVAGTNGKTTTARLVTSIVREDGKTYLQNKAGANLVNGLASTLIRGSELNGKLNTDYLIFEADENALPKIIKETNPDHIIALDLFRDQLDRYGEVDSIAHKWHDAFEKLNDKTTLILNADDPQIAYLGTKTKAKVAYFGLNTKDASKDLKHGADSTHCPKCNEKLIFSTVFFSHLGVWKCPKCKLKRPTPDITDLSVYPLVGDYNKYNALAAALFGKHEKIDIKKTANAYRTFTPAFGRQEKLNYNGKKVQIFLSKNPTSFNESLEAIKELKGENLLILLNDRIPDGLDVSWIWDINFEDILDKKINVAVSGDRAYDMGLRLKYAEHFTHVSSDLKHALDQMIDKLEDNETLYILPNYSAMLDIRKIITGRKIL
jgi:lipid II isoglutaminyl synthase (glutamine-hydrolysing)